jgi:hypothetical protein
MAAQETFENFNASLAPQEREILKDFIRNKRDELLASRSEDARVRLVHECIKDVREVFLQER